MSRAMIANVSITQRVYSLVAPLPRHRWPVTRSELPDAGIYLFYEDGERGVTDEGPADRIVRVGTHALPHGKRGPGRQRLADRIYSHFKGNKNASSFRKDVGAALLRRADPHHSLLDAWCSSRRSAETTAFEPTVSEEMREHFSFVCIRADAMEDRQALERGLIALLAKHPLGQPSAQWLGRFAVNETVCVSGLWNKDHIDAEPLTLAQFERLRDCVEVSWGGAW